jgi:hypothetical protein
MPPGNGDEFERKMARIDRNVFIAAMVISVTLGLVLAELLIVVARLAPQRP